MTYTRTIQVRLSREQYRRIKADSLLHGFNRMSPYIRYLALGKNFMAERKLDEIHKAIIGKKSTRQGKVRISKHPPFISS